MPTDQITEMLDRAKRLVRLLEDREIGLLSWHRMVEEQMHDLNVFYDGPGAMARIARAETALKRYGRHEFHACAAWTWHNAHDGSGYAPTGHPCSCGFDAALKGVP